MNPLLLIWATNDFQIQNTSSKRKKDDQKDLHRFQKNRFPKVNCLSFKSENLVIETKNPWYYTKKNIITYLRKMSKKKYSLLYNFWIKIFIFISSQKLASNWILCFLWKGRFPWMELFLNCSIFIELHILQRPEDLALHFPGILRDLRKKKQQQEWRNNR